MGMWLLSRMRSDAEYAVRSIAPLSRDRYAPERSRFSDAALRFASCCVAPGTSAEQNFS